jgi:murE/murF fusion protein
VVKILNLDIKKTLNFYKSNKLLEGRGKIYNVKRFKINFNLIDESYNANPLSVKNAIKNLTKLKTKNSKKYLLLGDMLELGSKSNLFHKNLSKFINKSDIDKVFIYGNKIFNAYKYTEKIKRGNILQYIYDFDEVFSSVLSKGDFLMIKGSNATGLNKLSKNIVKGFSHVI